MDLISDCLLPLMQLARLIQVYTVCYSLELTTVYVILRAFFNLQPK